MNGVGFFFSRLLHFHGKFNRIDQFRADELVVAFFSVINFYVITDDINRLSSAFPSIEALGYIFFLLRLPIRVLF